MARTENQVDMTAILLTIQSMQKKIDLLMMRPGLLEEKEAVVVPSPTKRPKKTPVSRSTSLFNKEASQTSSISANDGAMVHTLTTSLQHMMVEENLRSFMNLFRSMMTSSKWQILLLPWY